MALTRLEKKMVEEGYDTFTLEEKNLFIQELARRNALPANQVTDEFILNHHKSIKKAMFRSKCQSNIRQGFVSSNGHTYRTDYDDQLNFMGKMIHLITDPTITTVSWKTEDEGYVEHERNEWIKVFGEGVKHKENNIFKYNMLLTQLEQAKTHEEVMAITWEGFNSTQNQ